MAYFKNRREPSAKSFVECQLPMHLNATRLDTMVRSGGKLFTRMAKLNERPSAWLVACKETIAMSISELLGFKVQQSTCDQGVTTCTVRRPNRSSKRPKEAKLGQQRPTEANRGHPPKTNLKQESESGDLSQLHCKVP